LIASVPASRRAIDRSNDAVSVVSPSTTVVRLRAPPLLQPVKA
jgi:hypothetical protein